MFSRWDPETGKQLDVENGFNKYQVRGLNPLTGEADRIPAKELDKNLKQMFKQSEVDPGVNVKQAIKLLMTEDKNGEWVDMFEKGIIDPTEVTRSALLNAASISALFITTEAGVSEIKKDEKEDSANEDMGGMY